MLTTILIVGSIAADIGLGAAAYRGVSELKKIFTNLDSRLTVLEKGDSIKIGFTPSER